MGVLPLALVSVESIGKSSVLFPAGVPCFGRLGKPHFSSEEPTLPSGSFSRLYWENQQVFIRGKKVEQQQTYSCLSVGLLQREEGETKH